MAPHEPLHQLLSILPMDLRLTMLTQNTVIRLYKVTKESQLLKQLGGNWYVPQPQAPHLPTLNNPRARTTLQSLVDKVVPKGPHIDLFPDLLPNAPTWNGRVEQIPKQTDWDYPQTVSTITNPCREGQVINVYCEGTISNNL